MATTRYYLTVCVYLLLQKSSVGAWGVGVVTRECLDSCVESDISFWGLGLNQACCRKDYCNSAPTLVETVVWRLALPLVGRHLVELIMIDSYYYAGISVLLDADTLMTLMTQWIGWVQQQTTFVGYYYWTFYTILLLYVYLYYYIMSYCKLPFKLSYIYIITFLLYLCYMYFLIKVTKKIYNIVHANRQ